MNQKAIYTATEVRQNFFEVLKLASQGKRVLIKSKKILFHFRLDQVEEESTKEKLLALKDLSKGGIKTLPAVEMKKIILQMHDRTL
ncbi:MAG: hypothetical protein ACMG6E_02265 [Candidatus Roizmanbacteria bacterium]